MVLTATAAWSHGGGLDGYGCHHNRKLGGYHCHRGPMAGQSFSSKEEMIVAAAGQKKEVTPYGESLPKKREREQPLAR